MSRIVPNIVLVGMPGSGKSTIGMVLARMLCRQFVDTDLLIQQRAGMPLQLIVDRNGYEALLSIEEEVLLALDCRNHVIATGGSAVYSPAAMKHLRASGMIVFLDTALSTLKSRIRDYDSRGLARRPDQTLEDLFAERIPLYRGYADLTVECGTLGQEEICSLIINELSRVCGIRTRCRLADLRGRTG